MYRRENNTKAKDNHATAVKFYFFIIDVNAIITDITNKHDITILIIFNKI